MNNGVKRCKQCNKIITNESKIGLCPKCADLDARRAAEVGVGALGVGLVLKKLWKPGMELAKGVAKILLRT